MLTSRLVKAVLVPRTSGVRWSALWLGSSTDRPGIEAVVISGACAPEALRPGLLSARERTQATKQTQGCTGGSRAS